MAIKELESAEFQASKMAFAFRRSRGSSLTRKVYLETLRSLGGDGPRRNSHGSSKQIPQDPWNFQGNSQNPRNLQGIGIEFPGTFRNPTEFPGSFQGQFTVLWTGIHGTLVRWQHTLEKQETRPSKYQQSLVSETSSSQQHIQQAKIKLIDNPTFDSW